MRTNELEVVTTFLSKNGSHDLTTKNCLLLLILVYPAKDRTKKKLLQYVDTVGVVISFGLCFCDLGEARTHDPLIKSQLLYQLSYEVIILVAFR